MINRAILEAQLGQYKKGKEQAVMAFNKAQADLYMFDGAIEACNALLAIEKAMEDHEVAEKKEATTKAAEEATAKRKRKIEEVK